MNSDQFATDVTPPAETAQQEAVATPAPRRRGTRRAADTQTTETTQETPTRRRRGAAAATDEPAAPEATSDAPARARRARTRAATPAIEASTEAPASADADATATPAEPLVGSIMLPLNSGEALVSDVEAVDQIAAEGPLTRTRRRRRGRGGRGNAAEVAETMDEAEAALPEVAAQPADAAAAAFEEAPDQTELAATAETTGTARRRRRRGRGGRGNAAEAVDATSDLEMAAFELAEPDLAEPESEETQALSPAVLRRFDHRDWRDRPGRATAPARPAPTQTPAQPAAASTPASPAPPAAATAEPVPFEPRGGRGSRYGDRRFTTPREIVTPPAATAQPAPPIATAQPAPRVTPPPIVTPSQPAVPEPLIAPRIDLAPGGGSVEERLERLLANQAALLQQQQQAMQSMLATMTALHGAIERMSTTGIAAGMPRAGIFVDAPNVIYAAENARVSIDYGRMLDFLSRGREMVHAIVYAPVTEESGYRFEGQRFVAPFMHKGYKLVTKPLKRFPDGTAKGNFDIELAIDIVTMSQRLDVVILLSGDSDFSRLIELIQSRGVRVEVVAFSSNVSWELVQMADVFIDIGQYLHEFRAL